MTQFCHNSGISVQSDIESLQAKLSAEKTKEDALFRSTLTSLCAASDEVAKISKYGLRSAAATVLSAWISSGTGHQGVYDEESMDRISTQLDDFLAVRNARNQMQQELRGLYETRKKVQMYAHRARAFVLAEEGIARLDASLHLPLPHILMNLSESLVKALPQRDSGPEYATDQAQSSTQTHDHTRRHVDVAAVTASTTVSFIYQRLAGLPTSLHRAYFISLALGIADVEKENTAGLGTTGFVLGEGAKDRMLRLCSRRSFACHYLERNSGIVEQAAQTFVDKVVDAGILATVVALSSGDSSKHLDDELLTVFMKIQKDFIEPRSDDENNSLTRSSFKQALYNEACQGVFFLRK